MSWEQEISEELAAVQNIAVRFDIEQQLTELQKTTARNNIGITTTRTNLSYDFYQLTFNN